MKKEIIYYFSFAKVVEGVDEADIVEKTEQMIEKELSSDCFSYMDERTIEDVK